MWSSVQQVAIVTQPSRFVKRRAGPPQRAAGWGCFPALWQWGGRANVGIQAIPCCGTPLADSGASGLRAGR